MFGVGSVNLHNTVSKFLSIKCVYNSIYDYAAGCAFSLSLFCVYCDVLMEKCFSFFSFLVEENSNKKIMISHKINTTLFFSRTH